MMCRNFAIILLCTLTLAKYSSAHPVRGPVNNYGLDEYRKLCSTSIEHARKVFVDVERELSAMPQKSENMQELSDHISTLLKQIAEYQAMGDDEVNKALLEGVLFGDIMGIQVPYLLNQEDKSMQELLDRNKMNEFLPTFESELGGFLQQLSTAIQKHIDNLSDDEKRQQQALIVWFNHFKRIKDVPQKFRWFSDFLRRFPEA